MCFISPWAQCNSESWQVQGQGSLKPSNYMPASMQGAQNCMLLEVVVVPQSNWYPVPDLQAN